MMCVNEKKCADWISYKWITFGLHGLNSKMQASEVVSSII